MLVTSSLKLSLLLLRLYLQCLPACRWRSTRLPARLLSRTRSPRRTRFRVTERIQASLGTVCPMRSSRNSTSGFTSSACAACGVSRDRPPWFDYGVFAIGVQTVVTQFFGALTGLRRIVPHRGTGVGVAAVAGAHACLGEVCAYEVRPAGQGRFRIAVSPDRTVESGGPSGADEVSLAYQILDDSGVLAPRLVALEEGGVRPARRRVREDHASLQVGSSGDVELVGRP